jgi:type IV secretory pathway VirJ component
MIPLLTLLLSQADPTISGAWALKLVAAIFSGLGVLVTAAWLAYKRGQAAPSMETTIKAPVPVVTVQSAPRWATHDEMAAVAAEVAELREDVDKKLDKLLAGQAEERKVAREALGKVHQRSDKNAEALAELKGELHGLSRNVERLLTIATTQTKTTGR